MRPFNLPIPIVWLATEDIIEVELVALNEAAQTGRDPHSIVATCK